MAWALPTQHKERWGWEGSLGSSCRVRVVEGPGVVPEVAAGLAHGAAFLTLLTGMARSPVGKLSLRDITQNVFC